MHRERRQRPRALAASERRDAAMAPGDFDHSQPVECEAAQCAVLLRSKHLVVVLTPAECRALAESLLMQAAEAESYARSQNDPW
jgi:hypothetical protein